jgi:hypothetical protein
MNVPDLRLPGIMLACLPSCGRIILGCGLVDQLKSHESSACDGEQMRLVDLPCVHFMHFVHYSWEKLLLLRSAFCRRQLLNSL